MKEVGVRDRKLFYREEGSGDVVLLVHGWGGSSYDWTRFMPLLAPRHLAVALDQIGFGRSDKPDLDYDLQTMLDHLVGFIDAVGLERFHLVGHSMGGQIAAAFALDHPDRVRSLVLLDAAGVSAGAPAMFSLGRFPRLIQALLARTPLALFNWHYRHVGPYYDPSFLTAEDVREHYHSYGNEAGARAAARCLQRILFEPSARLDDKLKTLSLPTLIVWGRQDPLLPLAMGREFARLIPGSRLHTLGRCGHCPQEEKPGELYDLLEKFWQES